MVYVHTCLKMLESVMNVIKCDLYVIEHMVMSIYGDFQWFYMGFIIMVLFYNGFTPVILFIYIAINST